MIYISFDIGLKNLAFCILRYENQILSIIDWGIIVLAESKKKVKGIENISNNLFHELDELIGKLESIDIHQIDYVIIENQPSNLNGIMKTIQYLIFSYFKLLKHWDQRVEEVILINPSLKLQYHDYEPASKQINETLSKREKYKYNKSDAIEICNNYIKNDDRLCDFFASNKKKDDLADTCLQVVSYLRKQSSNIQSISIDIFAFI
jgi:hypothetical protein